MADTDDLAPPPAPRPRPTDLASLSIDELEAYIGELQAEIGRARGAIADKQTHRDSVEALFRKPDPE
ncbi:MAG: DUF1192 domain-containing protein [Azospirillaceae bacterium]